MPTYLWACFQIIVSDVQGPQLYKGIFRFCPAFRISASQPHRHEIAEWGQNRLEFSGPEHTNHKLFFWIKENKEGGKRFPPELKKILWNLEITFDSTECYII